MHVTTPLLILSSLLLTVLADPVAQAVPPQQTIVPFATLPSCAKQCGKLFDVQGACSPPLVDAANTKTCFCADPRLTAFTTGTAGPCDQAACDASDLTLIQKWYNGVCGTTNAGTAATTTSSGAGSATGGAAKGSTAASSSGNGSGGGGDTWISTHVKVVIMLVILIIAIGGGWIGALLLRRRYLARKDREYELRPTGTPWVGGKSHSPYGDGVVGAGANKEARSSSVLGAPAVAHSGEKNSKKKWTVKERT